MKRTSLNYLLAVFFLAATAAICGASPIISAVDMDPSTPGVQTSMTVTEGDVFTVEVVLYVDTGVSLGILQVVLDLLYNGNMTPIPGGGYITIGRMVVPAQGTWQIPPGQSLSEDGQ